MVPAAGMIWADYMPNELTMIFSGFSRHVLAICEHLYQRMHLLNLRQMRMRLDDRLVEYDFASYAHAHISDSELITFKSGGLGLMRHHEQYRKVVAGFLKKHL